MKWFVITNRERKNKSFGGDPEKHGKIHFLSKERASFPRKDRDLKVDYNGHSGSPAAIQAFTTAVQDELKKRAETLKSRGADRKPSLVLYTHGYNNTYIEALEEYSELRRNFHDAIGGDDFEAQCLPILFTWASEGATLKYLEDRDDARASYPAISNMVHLLFEQTGNLQECLSNVCVIAHSMGNYVFREALGSVSGSARAPLGTFISQFVAIGADIGNTSLEPGGKGFGMVRFCDRISVYFTPADSTLGKSKRKNNRARLGRTLSSNYQATGDNVLFIDCREWANEEALAGLFGNDAPSVHSCYRSVPAILEDMFQTISGVDREMVRGRESRVMNKLYHMQRPAG